VLGVRASEFCARAWFLVAVATADEMRVRQLPSRSHYPGGSVVLGMPPRSKRGKHAASLSAVAPDHLAEAKAGGKPDGGGNPEDGINHNYNSVIQDAISSIKAHTIFSGIDDAMPLCMASGAGGAQAPFSSADFRNAMKGAGHYVCGGNFWWQDPLYTPCPGVPMNVTCVEKMSSHLFAEPAPFPVMMTVGVSEDTCCRPGGG